MQPHTARITLANRIPDIQRAADFMDGFLEQHPVPGVIANELHVILDEVLSNVIRHGYDDDAVHEIGFALGRSREEVTLEVEDDGKPFDPTAAATAGRPAPESIMAGGLGLVFVRAFADSMSYRREGGRNRLTIRRQVPQTAAAALARAGMALSETREGDIAILEVEGRLESVSAWTMKDRLLAMIEDGVRRVIVDVERTGYIGSAGFWALLLADRLLRSRGGGLALCGLNSQFARALEQGGFTSMLSVFATRAEALAAGRAHRRAPIGHR